MSRFGKVLVFCLMTVTLSHCQKPEKDTPSPRPIIFALTVADIDISMSWYSRHLGFTADTVMNFPTYGLSVGMMHQGDFYLEFV